MICMGKALSFFQLFYRFFVHSFCFRHCQCPIAWPLPPCPSLSSSILLRVRSNQRYDLFSDSCHSCPAAPSLIQDFLSLSICVLPLRPPRIVSLLVELRREYVQAVTWATSIVHTFLSLSINMLICLAYLYPHTLAH